MDGKKMLGTAIAQAKKTCELMDECSWILGFANGHYTIGASGPCVQVKVDWLRKAFKSHLVKEFEGFEYHYFTEDGVTFYCLVDKEDEE